MSRIPFRHPSSEARGAGGASGQTLAEYAMIIAAIAVACVFAVLFLVAIRERVDSTGQPSPQSPFVPPASPALSYPTRPEDCEDGGWKNYVQFRDEAECRKYVEEHTP